jgi:hypothetical protein
MFQFRQTLFQFRQKYGKFVKTSYDLANGACQIVRKHADSPDNILFGNKKNGNDTGQTADLRAKTKKCENITSDIQMLAWIETNFAGIETNFFRFETCLLKKKCIFAAVYRG